MTPFHGGGVEDGRAANTRRSIGTPCCIMRKHAILPLAVATAGGQASASPQSAPGQGWVATQRARPGSCSADSYARRRRQSLHSQPPAQMRRSQELSGRLQECPGPRGDTASAPTMLLETPNVRSRSAEEIADSRRRLTSRNPPLCESVRRADQASVPPATARRDH